jgi:hypothetical protein
LGENKVTSRSSVPVLWPLACAAAIASSVGNVTELASANSCTKAPILGFRIGLRNFSVGFFMIFV